MRDGLLKFAIPIAAIFAMASGEASATPDAETAKRCLRAAYLLYPYKRPGAAPMRGDRLFYFNECMARSEKASQDPTK